jgi:hypothetical protein
LLKEGNKRALMLFGFGDPDQIQVVGFSFDTKSLAIGEELRFSFEIKIIGNEVRRIRLEYAVDFVKSGDKISRKVFQIREADFEAGNHTLTRKHSFKDLSTRKHYPGLHRFTIVINGVEKTTGSIELVGQAN